MQLSASFHPFIVSCTVEWGIEHINNIDARITTLDLESIDDQEKNLSIPGEALFTN